MYARAPDRAVFFDVEGTHTGWRDGRLVERPVLLVVHGGPGIPHVYLRPWLAPLAERYCLVYVDLRGSGRSGRLPGSGYPLAGFVDDLELVREALGLEHAALLGHSFGGVVAMEYALAHPRRVDALVLACTIHSFGYADDAVEAETQLLGDELAPELEDFAARGLAAWEGGDPDAFAALDEHPVWAKIVRTQFHGPVPGLWEQAVENLELGAEAYFANTGAAAFRWPGAPLVDWDVRPRLGGIRAPTLVLGAGSPTAEYAAPPDVHARELDELLPDSRLVVVPDVGHYLFAESPTAFCDPIAAFLADVGLDGADPDRVLLAAAGHHRALEGAERA